MTRRKCTCVMQRPPNSVQLSGACHTVECEQTSINRDIILVCAADHCRRPGTGNRRRIGLLQKITLLNQ